MAGKAAGVARDAANAKAAASIWAQKNNGKDLWEIDLHLLLLAEARCGCRPMMLPPSLVIPTCPLRSRQNRPMIRPTILAGGRPCPT